MGNILPVLFGPIGALASYRGAPPAPPKMSPSSLDEMKLRKWRFDVHLRERNMLRDATQKLYKIYKEVDEPNWERKMTTKQIQDIIRDESLRMQSILKDAFQEAQVMQKTSQTQEGSIDLNDRYLRTLDQLDISLNKEIYELNKKVNHQDSIISERYGMITRHRRALVAGRVLTVLTLISILLFVIANRIMIKDIN